ncbi:hypothetical protein LEP1GSC188_4018 [Leptospira weilii serovar Topaz str. LT2116]|uniref:Uncharacterized protein n=1 Tax=Leptospira weilii serovar Topaz str. LT2116 TaxID=1088540 RepID=M3FVB9_9LEPT|nr:hypothetical protein LEP1GSC188_4018 [Leptospira weilii serovar Topaz str. LT2116]
MVFCVSWQVIILHLKLLFIDFVLLRVLLSLYSNEIQFFKYSHKNFWG